MMTDETIELVRGSGNVFADFGYPSADAEHLIDRLITILNRLDQDVEVKISK
jgi:hypothetical protein